MGFFMTILQPFVSFFLAYKWYLIIGILAYVILTVIFRHARGAITLVFGIVMLFFIITNIGGVYSAVEELCQGLADTAVLASEDYVDYFSNEIINNDDLTPAEKLKSAVLYALTGSSSANPKDKLPTSDEIGFGETLDFVTNTQGKGNEDGAFKRFVDGCIDFGKYIFNEIKALLGFETPVIPEEPNKQIVKSEPRDNVETKDSGSTAQVHFLDVGQADATLITDGNYSMLIDTGNYEDIDYVYQYLEGLGITSLDYLVLTHPHEDHIGCAATIMRLLDVKTVIVSPATAETVCYEQAEQEIRKQKTNKIIAKAGSEFTLGDGKFILFGPYEIDKEEMNNNSVVLKYIYGKTSFLFTGDASRNEEINILDAGYDIGATVLKVGHHGSNSSTTYPFLREVMPMYSVISCGEDNMYGHPHDDLMSRLRDSGSEVYRTDLHGSIVMSTDGTNIAIDKSK